MNPDDPTSTAGPASEPTIWLSGKLVTLFNKLLFPPLWMGGLIGILGWALLTTGGLHIAPGFRWLAALIVAVTLWMLWFVSRLQLVGYAGRELVVANYWRQARIPFTSVASVEPVWWYPRRLVRIRFNTPTPFGWTVYYLPKWGPFRLLMTAPDEELRRIIF